MIITRLKAKNQVTIPKDIMRRLHLRADELFSVVVEGNYIRLTPVEIEPRYTTQELQAIDRIVEKEKGQAKAFKLGKEFSSYIKKIKK